MEDLPRQKLCEIVATYGRVICDEPRRCEGLLKDLCGEHKGEISILVNALKERVAADLLSSQDSMPLDLLMARLTKRLQQNLYLAEDAARWAVESWALALGKISMERAGNVPIKKEELKRPSFTPPFEGSSGSPPEFSSITVFKKLRILSLIQMIGTIVAIVITLITVEPIIISGPILSAIGIAIAWYSLRCRLYSGIVFGLSMLAVSLLCLGLILAYNWSPRDAQSPIGIIVLVYGIVFLPLGVRTLLILKNRSQTRV